MAQGKEKRNSLQNMILRTWRQLGLALPSPRSLKTPCMMMRFIKLRRYRSSADSYWDDMAPELGYFAVYVGPDRTRFVIKIEWVNDPLFGMLLEQAEKEYGFDFAGPLTLPCEVAVFRRILEALNTEYGGEDPLNGDDVSRRAWTF